MTDKQIIETLNNIRKYCTGTKCDECKFNLTEETEISLFLGAKCQFKAIAMELAKLPNYWRIDKIEEIIKQ